MWKKNVMEEMESGEVEYESAEEFLTCLKREFGGGEEESVKAAELRKLEQGGKTMEEFVQEFKRTARGSGYEGRPLVEEFKRGMNGGIRRKLMEAENPPASIEQWYRRATALDRNWRESKREEGTRRRGPKTGAETNIATTINVAEETTVSSAGDNRACSDGGSRKNECGGHEGAGSRGSSKTGPLCDGHRSWKKLLCLRGIRAYGPTLQK